MSRIGVAAGNSLERRGFHAPGLTGTFGAAIAAGRLLGMNEKRWSTPWHRRFLFRRLDRILALSGRSHDQAAPSWQAAEGGVTAALLASRGFAGPESVLEGKFGFCQSFSDSPKLEYLTHRLGQEW